MKTRTLLRTAAILTILQAIGHTFGGVLGKIEPGSQMIAVEAMKANAFDVFGHTRTFWDFYIGFGLCISVFGVMQAGLLLAMAESVEAKPARWRAILWVLLLANIANGVLGVRFFFLAAVVTPAINVICLAVALTRSWSSGRIPVGMPG